MVVTSKKNNDSDALAETDASGAKLGMAEQPGIPAKKTTAKSGPVALVLSVLALAGVGLGGWYGWQHLSTLASTNAQVNELKQELAKQNQQLAVLQTDNFEQQKLRDDMAAHLQQKVTVLGDRVDGNGKRIQQLQGTNREDWLLAEAEYLLRLANQRLLTERDLKSAESLLLSADAIIHSVDDYSLSPVRQALQEDLVALRSVSNIDYSGVFLHLSALAKEVMNLPLLPVADFHQEPGAVTEPAKEDASSWHARLLESLRQAWHSFASLYRINTNREEPVNVLLTPNEEVYLRQNLRLMLEQAQLALMQGQQAVYSDSLEKANSWLKRYFPKDSQQVLSVEGQLQQLQKIEIRPELPDISRSVKGLKNYLDELHRRSQVPVAPPRQTEQKLPQPSPEQESKPDDGGRA